MNATTSASIAATGDAAGTEEQMLEIGRRAKAAARRLALATPAQKDAALSAMAQAIRARSAAICEANAEDVAEARRQGMTPSFVDRLSLDPARVEAIAAGVDLVRSLPDPVGEVMSAWDRPTACASSASVFRSASSASSTRAGRTSRRMPRRSA